MLTMASAADENGHSDNEVPRGRHDASDGEASDADSDYMELQDDIAKLDASRQAFLSQHLGADFRSQPASSAGMSKGGGAGARVRRRGPRKAVEPTGEVKIKLSHANTLFVSGQYDEALDTLQEIIRLNAETHDAWALLASIYDDMGQREDAIMAKMFAAHLRPRDVMGWLSTADYALAESQEDYQPQEGEDDADAADRARLRRLQNLQIARLCYSGAIRADSRNIAARLGKANVCLEFGQASNAATEYIRVLKRKPYDLQVVRNLAEASYDSSRREEIIRSAIDAYRTVIDCARAGAPLDDGATFEWMDVVIYVELFAGLARYGEAITALRSLARWMLGRKEEAFWDRYQDDDREWDRSDMRMKDAPEFVAGRYPPETYGAGLPVDLRAKLAIYRLKLDHEEEAMEHLSWLHPDDPRTPAAVAGFPHLLKDIGSQLYEVKRTELALQYFNLYRIVNAEVDYVDADALVQQGKCYLDMHDNTAAEECFLAAIEADDDNIEARYELARIYESAHEKEQAFILVNEALSLEAHHHQLQQQQQQEEGEQQQEHPEGGEEAGGSSNVRKDIAAEVRRGNMRFVLHGNGKLIQKPRTYARRKMGARDPLKKRATGPRKVPVRRRPRRLADASQRMAFEQEVSNRLKEKYHQCRELRGRVVEGDREATAQWMEAAKELTDDFRSFREFYPWEKYVQFLGYNNFLDHTGPASNLTAMAERLQQKLAPAEDESAATGKPPAAAARLLQRREHRGIPFDDWLELFLEYAVGLAHAGRAPEAYAVCQSARDSIVYRGTADSMFLIHVAWASCAVHAGDEETCVAVARYFMRDMPFSTDTYRMYGAMCRLCRSPSSWYSSGPAQKYMLRQIRHMDEALRAKTRGGGARQRLGEGQQQHFPWQGDGPLPKELDVCLLMVYGHILFASTSYSYALNYFHRAATLDRANPAVNLSIGLAYVHWALKRQADNRQYMLAQGMTYLFRYHDARVRSPLRAERREARFNVARTYHLLGLHALAAEYYSAVLEDAGGGGGEGEGEGERGLEVEAAYNLRTYYLLAGNMAGAMDVTRRWLTM